MKLIPLDAVLAIIEKFMYDANLEADIASTGECFDEKVADCKYQLCKSILDRINSLEVKEVDLEKEFEEYVVDDPIVGDLVNFNAAMLIAKHFFNLGLKAQKGERV